MIASRPRALVVFRALCFCAFQHASSARKAIATTLSASQAAQVLRQVDQGVAVSFLQTEASATWNLPTPDQLLQQSRDIFEKTEAELGDAKLRLAQLKAETERQAHEKEASLTKEVEEKRQQVAHAFQENQRVADENEQYAESVVSLRSQARVHQDHMDSLARNLQSILDNMTFAQEYADVTLERTSSSGDLDPEGPFQVFNQLQAKDAARFALEEKQEKLDMIAATNHGSQSGLYEHLYNVVQEIQASAAASSTGATQAAPSTSGIATAAPGSVEDVAFPAQRPEVPPPAQTSLLQMGTLGIADEIEGMVKNSMTSQKSHEEELLEAERDEQERQLADLLRQRAGLEDQEDRLRERVEKLQVAVDFLASRQRSMAINYRYLLHFATYVGNDRRWTDKVVSLQTPLLATAEPRDSEVPQLA